MEYLFHIAIMMSIFSILTVSHNILMATGIFAPCHAAFYGIGAYTTAFLMMRLHFGFFSALCCSVPFTAILSLLIAIPGLRVHWDYMVVFAFAFQLVAYHVMLNWTSITGGASGMAGIPPAEVFGFKFDSSFSFLLLALALTAAVVYVAKRIDSSSFGLVMKGIKDNAVAVNSIGKSVTVYKIVSFAIASGMAAVGGGLLAVYLSYISPAYFDLHVAFFILICLIFGGLGTIKGAVLGACVLVALPELLRFIPGLPSTIVGGIRDLIYALILLLFMLYRPQGVVGKEKQ